MPSTSGTYDFQSVQVELLIREAFERVGIAPEFVEPAKLESARRSINLILLGWIDQSTNLWTLQGTYIPLVTGQRQYTIPSYVSNIVQANLRIYTRQLNGTPRSNAGTSYDGAGGGVAADAFDGNPATFCVQGAINGNISYDFGDGNEQTITFLGIQSHTTSTYNLALETTSLDPTVGANWKLVYAIPSQSFTAGVLTWLDIPTPLAGRYIRIREKGGATLNMEEIYFSNNTQDFILTPVSRYEYNTYPNKYLQSRPNVYYLDRQLTPVINIWPTPTADYNCLYYSYKRMMQDVGLYTNSVEIPARFYPALVWGLSWHLAIKYNPEVSQMMKTEYEQAFAAATIDDSEEVTISIQGDYSRWSR